jgi:hypothetical protein
MITVSGNATKREGLNSNPAAGVTVAAYKNGDDATVIAMATTDAAGHYTMTIPTGGVALDGYLKGTLGGFLDTYLYPPKALAADFDMASMNMVNQSTLDTLSGSLCKNAQDSTKGLIAVIVADANNSALPGAMVSSTPEAMKYCYNKSGTLGTIPNDTATVTETDGIGYMINLPPGNVSVTATKANYTFPSHSVEARAGVLTTTVIQSN